MQNMFCPFWLMIASTATAVLPVWRSPMISSRWPRPTGTMESIALRPVCTGCDTDLRQITPGATFSILSVSLALIGPLPSIGSPRALTTRPTSSGPIGTSRMRPVHLTVSPSEMCSYSPRITAPTESRSRFRARPKEGWPSLPAGNSSISPCIASDRPWTRTMPSVTETTVPWLRMSAWAPRPSMRLLISSEISAGLSCIAFSESAAAGANRLPVDMPVGGCLTPCSVGQRDLHLRQARLDRGVEHLVAHDHAHTADERLIDLHRGVELAAEALFQRGDGVGQLGSVEREGAVDRGVGHAAAGVDQRAELRGDRGQCGQLAVLEDDRQQVGDLRIEGDLGHGGDQVDDLLGRDLRVVGELAQLRVGGDGADGLDLFGQGTCVTGAGSLEQGFGVGTGDGCYFGHFLARVECRDQSSVFRRVSSSAWTPALTSRFRICSAPLTASTATCSRRASRAFTDSCSASALAAATILAPSSLARDLASSTSCWARRSASARRLAASSLADVSAAATFFSESASATLALSAADRPSAIFFARSSRAAVIGGQTNFIVNQTRIRNTIIWTMRVPVMLTCLPQTVTGTSAKGALRAARPWPLNST